MTTHFQEQVEYEAAVKRELKALHEQWSKCQDCKLGERRIMDNGPYIPGVGVPRGILFVAGGPGWREAKEGVPIAEELGNLIHLSMRQLKVPNYYITSVVGCRSCEPSMDDQGVQKMRKLYGGKMVLQWKDTAPQEEFIKACSPRFHDEVYLVDPVVIVALGASAITTLAHRPAKIGDTRGKPEAIAIPGRGYAPSLTAKKQMWPRKVEGKLVLPTLQSQVMYTMIPTYDPAAVLTRVNDKGSKSILSEFLDDLKLATRIYDKYMEEAHGITVESRVLEAEDVRIGMAEQNPDFDPAEYARDQGEIV